ncbi:efflux RND transporter periplasmic adaptor subunit [Halotalea alkalilenta]|uniref:efflux RND transporter periplasmic adaptor subunit n=1 Tax=Halotalea alkalilenta TaxID=376489 RepID=UPI0006932485|nr:efflux RND transporter periplasmic adaptor subunit [Halotalea alkalilenta]
MWHLVRQAHHPRRFLRHRSLQALMVGALASLALGGCGEAGPERGSSDQASQATPVTVVRLAERETTLVATFPGRTLASATAEVRPQVGGVILERSYAEGSDIAAGDLLFRIDPRRYRADAERARSELAVAKARLDSARWLTERYQRLGERQAISQQEHQMALFADEEAAAAVAAAESALHSAEIDLAYTELVAPISGRIGRASVTQGALVVSDQAEPLATIHQLDPIHVDFTQSGTEYLAWARAWLSPDGGGEKPKAWIVFTDASRYERTGEVEFADPEVDRQTGNVTLRASFANPGFQVLPGMFVRIEVEQARLERALLVPQRAVARDTGGDAYVYVVDDEQRARTRRVELGATVGSEWLVKAGLAAGDLVVLGGRQRIGDGSLVRVLETDVAAPDDTAEEG